MEPEVLTLEEIERIFPEPTKFDSIKKWVKENLLSKVDWRKSWTHFNIYNKLAFTKGYLDKLEYIRRNISIKSAEEIIDLHFVLGFSNKRILYALCKLGFDIHSSQLCNYISLNKRRLEVEREKFLNGFKTDRMNIFHNIYQQVHEVERKTLEIYLNKIKDLQDQLKDIDPVAEGAKFSRIRKYIQEMQLEINKAHGIDQMRTEIPKVAGQAAADIFRKKLEEDQDKANKTPTDLVGGLIEGSSDLVTLEANDRAKALPVLAEEELAEI